MSNAVIAHSIPLVNDKLEPIFINANVRKSHVDIDRGAAFRKILPSDMSQTSPCNPRTFKSNMETARTAMGAGVTPVSFMTGLSFALASWAFGSVGRVDDVCAGLPAHAAFAVKVACSFVKRGAGIDRATLESVVCTAVQAMLELPVKAKTIAPKPIAPELPTKVIESDELTAQQIDRRNISADIADNRAAESLLAAVKAHAEKVMEKPADLEQTAYEEGVSVVELIAKLEHDQALELVRQMAETLGYRLSKLPAKKAA